MKSRTWLLCVVAAVLSAALLTALFPPFAETAGAAFALAPLLAVSRMVSPKAAGWTWFGGGFAFWTATLSWMPAICKNGGPWPLVLLGWAGLAALCAGYFALFGWLDARAWRKWGRGALVAEPVLWAGIEWLRGILFTGFAWNFMGTALVPAPTFLSPARWGGIYLVSALLVAVNGVFATVICRIAAQLRGEAPRGRRWTRTLETALPLAVATVAVAAARVPPSEGETVRCALVQRNGACVFSRRDKGIDPLEIYDRLLEAAAAVKPDLTVWGESAMSEFGEVTSEGARHAALYCVRRTGGSALLAGGDWLEKREDGNRLHNAAALYVPEGQDVSVQIYAKQHLVPFGEYIPFDKLVPALQKLSPIGVSLHPGEAKVLDTGKVKIAPLICFEDTDPALARKAARMGAQLLALVTNDSWFGGSAEAWQHAWQAVARAVETGLPVIRTGNSGVTGLIRPNGRTEWLSDGEGKPLVDAAGCQTVSATVPASPSPTPYSRFGDWPMLILFTTSLMGILVVKYGHGK